MSWDMFANALIEGRRRQEFVEGIKAWVQLYYNEYTDADEVDPAFRDAIHKLAGLDLHTDIIEEVIGDDRREDEEDLEAVDVLIRQMEREITGFTGRRFKSTTDNKEVKP